MIGPNMLHLVKALCKPPNVGCRTHIKGRDIRFHVQERGTIHNVDVFDVHLCAFHLDQPHDRQSDQIRPLRCNHEARTAAHQVEMIAQEEV